MSKTKDSRKRGKSKYSAIEEEEDKFITHYREIDPIKIDFEVKTLKEEGSDEYWFGEFMHYPFVDKGEIWVHFSVVGNKELYFYKRLIEVVIDDERFNVVFNFINQHLHGLSVYYYSSLSEAMKKLRQQKIQNEQLSSRLRKEFDNKLTEFVQQREEQYKQEKNERKRIFKEEFNRKIRSFKEANQELSHSNIKQSEEITDLRARISKLKKQNTEAAFTAQVNVQQQEIIQRLTTELEQTTQRLKMTLIEQEEQKNVDEAQEIDIKKDINNLENQLNKFTETYDPNKILEVFNQSAESLLIMDDLDSLELTVKSFGKHLMDITSYIQSLIHPDVIRYREWGIDEMCQWISLLENGRFRPYLEVLRSGFKNDGILAGQHLVDIQTIDLRVEPFRIQNFADRRDLVNHFASLKNPQINDNDEGLETEWH